MVTMLIKRDPPQCVEPGCLSSAKSHGYGPARLDGSRIQRFHSRCRKHLRYHTKANRTNRAYGSVNGHMGNANPNWTDTPTYQAAHSRVKAAKGFAQHSTCIDCGKPAADWSYIGGDPNELVGTSSSGSRCVYSADPEYYVPRCRRCHRIHDLGVSR